MAKLIDIVKNVGSVLSETEAAFFRAFYLNGESIADVGANLHIKDPEAFNRDILRKLRGGAQNVLG